MPSSIQDRRFRRCWWRYESGSTLLGLKDLSEVRRNRLIGSSIEVKVPWWQFCSGLCVTSTDVVPSFGRTRGDPLWVPPLSTFIYSAGFVAAVKFMQKSPLVVPSRTLCSLRNSKNVAMGPVRRRHCLFISHGPVFGEWQTTLWGFVVLKMDCSSDFFTMRPRRSLISS